MKNIVLAIGLVCSVALVARADEGNSDKVMLWPEGKMPHPQAHQKYAPSLQWYLPPYKPNGACVILISGGGYNSLTDGALLARWNEKLSADGFQCVSLKYRTPPTKIAGLPGHQAAWEDGQRAVRLVRQAAAARGFAPDKIGAMGMSAGAHLTTLLAVNSTTNVYARVDALDDTPCHVNFAITGAIAYGLDNREDRPTLLPYFLFDDKTPPMCLNHGGTDGYSTIHSTAFYRRLRAKGLYAELNLYADRSHGFWGDEKKPLDEQTTYDNWFEPIHAFLAHLGYVPEAEPRALPAKPDVSKLQVITKPGVEKDPSKPTIFLTDGKDTASTVKMLEQYEALRKAKVQCEFHTVTADGRTAARDFLWGYLNATGLNGWKPTATPAATLPDNLTVTEDATFSGATAVTKGRLDFKAGILTLKDMTVWPAGSFVFLQGGKKIVMDGCRLERKNRSICGGKPIVWEAKDTVCKLDVYGNQLPKGSRLHFVDSDMLVCLDVANCGGDVALENTRLVLFGGQLKPVENVTSFALSGPYALLYCKGDLLKPQTFSFDFPAGGFAHTVPVRVEKGLTLAEGCTITVDATKLAAGTYPLICAGSLHLPDGRTDALTLRAKCAAGRQATLVRDGETLTLVVKSSCR